MQRLLFAIHPEDLATARAQFWGKHLSLCDEWAGDERSEMAECAFEAWVFYDELDEGETHAEFMLASETNLSPGERAYIEMGRRSSMRLYEVIAVQPGTSITFRDVLNGSEIRVSERNGSRCVHIWDLVAARIFAQGASGQPEIDGGMLPLRSGFRESIVKQLTEMHIELGAAELKEQQALLLFDAWVTPFMPKMVNYDGETQILTTVHFDVVDEGKLVHALDHGPEFERDGDALIWSWIGIGTQQKESISRGFLRIAEGRLEIQTNSRERGERAKDLVEKLGDGSAKYRVTEYQDLEQAIAEARNKPREPKPLPKELVEPARQAILQHYQQHYEKWVDEPVPMLDSETPRNAARMPRLRVRVADLIEGLEGMYERALEEQVAAYDPTWMWEELDLEDLARGRSRKQAVPKLPHEVLDELEPDLMDVANDIAERVRRMSGDMTRVIGRREVESDLGFHRLAREVAEETKKSTIASWTETMANFELHLRKIFWVDEPLAWMLGATTPEITGDVLRAPFASFALVFTDRYALGLAERMLAEDASARLRGRILSVLTVFVTANILDDERTEMRMAFVADAHDGGWPDLVVREVMVRKDALLTEILKAVAPGTNDEEISTIAESVANRELAGLVFNAILYATSAEAEPVPGDPRGMVAPEPRRRRNGQVPPSNGIFRLPGKIDIGSLKQLKKVRRGASDVQAMRRCMVRGHWRRAGKNFKDERPRWIRPYWRGPSGTAIVEREYCLK